MSPVQPFQKFENHFSRPEVQIACRFVGQKDGGSADKSTREYNALLFPSR